VHRRTFLATAALGVSAALAGSAAGREDPTRSFEITKSEEEWRRLLHPERFKVLRKHATERAGSSPLNQEHRRGTYHCAGCDLPLFASEAKFESGTGWPSFTAPLDNAVGTAVDRSLFTVRTEVHCRRCGGHLGHVFDDGPKPTFKRYCMNGLAMTFKPWDGQGA